MIPIFAPNEHTEESTPAHTKNGSQSRPREKNTQKAQDANRLEEGLLIKVRANERQSEVRAPNYPSSLDSKQIET